MHALPKRMNKFSLTIHPEKSKLFKFVPENKSKECTLNFLGFTHYWTKSQKGKLITKRKTSKKGLKKSIKRLADSCRYNRHKRLKEQYQLLCSKLRGLYQYYGIRGNFIFLAKIYRQAFTLCGINGSTAEVNIIVIQYQMLLKYFSLPKPKIIHWNV